MILGFSTSESADAFPGSIRAFSVLDGELVWQFNTIPAPGDPGSETWADGSLARAGGANVWTGMTLDEERGLLFAPTGSATPDFYGVNRLGDNLYANSLLAIDARTGRLEWHYQVTRHDLWDRDNPSPPTLTQLERDGRTIDAVALTTKSGHLYMFDRETGESIYPIVEVDQLQSTLPGEVPAAMQPVSTVAFSRQTFEVTNRTEEARRFVQAQIDRLGPAARGAATRRHRAPSALVRRRRRMGRVGVRPDQQPPDSSMRTTSQGFFELSRGPGRLQRLRHVCPALRKLPWPGCWKAPTPVAVAGWRT